MTTKERFTKIENFLATLAEGQIEHEKEIRELRKMHKNLVMAVGKIAEAQRHTDQTVDALGKNVDKLTDTVERLVKGLMRPNGKRG